jgi:hypothetical protein
LKWFLGIGKRLHKTLDRTGTLEVVARRLENLARRLRYRP